MVIAVIHYLGGVMAVTRPRFSITVSEELNAVLLDLAELTGGARASIAAEFLEESLPAISQVAKALRLARKDAPSALDLLNDTLLQVTQQGIQTSLDISDTRRKIVKSPRKPKQAKSA